MLTCKFAFFSQNGQSDPAEKRRGGVYHQVRYDIPSKVVIYIQDGS